MLSTFELMVNASYKLAIILEDLSYAALNLSQWEDYRIKQLKTKAR